MSYLTTVTPIPATTASASTSTATTSTPRTGPIDPCRLFIGNLSPTVDEYTLIQVFTKCGKIAKMDYLFHKTGPLKGKPRGYAFVEYANKEDAAKALRLLHQRALRGRNLVVTQASASPVYDPSKPYRRPGDAPRSTTLSLLKKQGRPQSTNAQIAALEAKIASMQNSPLSTSAPGSPGPEGEDDMTYAQDGEEGWKGLLEGTELEEPTSSGKGTAADGKGKGRAVEDDQSTTTNMQKKPAATAKVAPTTEKPKGKLHPSLPSKPPAAAGGQAFGQGQGQRLGGVPSQGQGMGMAHVPRSGPGTGQTQERGLGHTVGGSGRRGGRA